VLSAQKQRCFCLQSEPHSGEELLISGCESIGKVINWISYSLLPRCISTWGWSAVLLIFSSVYIYVKDMLRHQLMVPVYTVVERRGNGTQRSAARHGATQSCFARSHRACTTSLFSWSFSYWISICRASVKNAWEGNMCIPVEHNTLNEIA
jgi:hypothetical protein